MSSASIIETGILFGLRATLFLGCRRFVLRTLYANLQDISAAAGDGDEDATLPPPTPIMKSKRPQHSVYASLASAVFSACFSESCMLFVLLLLEGGNVFDPGTRLTNWQFSLSVLLLTILALVPFLFAFLLFSPGSSTHARIVTSTACVLLALFLLSFVPAHAGSGLMESALARLIVLGTSILGILAGVGAVGSVWAYLPWREEIPTPTPGDISTAAAALATVRADAERKQADMARRAQAESGSAQTSRGSWMARVVGSVRGDDDALELRALTTLSSQMASRLEILTTHRADALYARTWRGRIEGCARAALAGWCVMRAGMSIVNLLLHRYPSVDSISSSNSYPDIATSLLTGLFPSSDSDPVDVEMIARLVRHASLVLVGLVILASVRGVLGGVARALRVTSRTRGAALMVLVLAQIMGIYLLATIVQLRASFPPALPSSSPSLPSAPSADNSTTLPEHTAPTMEVETRTLLSTIPPFAGFTRLFDGTFLLAAAVAGVWRWGAGRVGDMAPP